MQPIVFDLLNTLLDESKIYNKFYSYVLKKYPIDIRPQEFINRFFQYQREHIFANSKKPFKEIVKLAYIKLVKDADVKDLEILFKAHKDIVFLPGIKEMLMKLQKKYQFFVLTNCSNDLVKMIDLPSKSLVKFEKIFTSEDNGVYKPNPGSYEKVIDYINLPANKIIYISSNEWDLKASKEFGFNVKSIGDMKS
jgi:2-haloacid dehalogenase|tara:strand:+ start:2231 stop:2812 length:582 start_codon:yes stop_codon:yes gene_type:complete